MRKNNFTAEEFFDIMEKTDINGNVNIPGINPKKEQIAKNIRSFFNELGDELRKHDVYLTAARWEACGMHHIEGACCGLPVLFHKEGGGINETCKNYGVEYDNIPSFFDGLEEIKKLLLTQKEMIEF